MTTSWQKLCGRSDDCANVVVEVSNLSYFLDATVSGIPHNFDRNGSALAIVVFHIYPWPNSRGTIRRNRKIALLLELVFWDDVRIGNDGELSANLHKSLETPPPYF